MAHRTMTICDKCGAEQISIKGKAYPDLWSVLKVTQHTYNEAGVHAPQNYDRDLCPKCSDTVSAVVGTK